MADGEAAVALAEAPADGLAVGLAVGEPALGEADGDAPGLADAAATGSPEFAGLLLSSPRPKATHQPTTRAATTATATIAPTRTAGADDRRRCSGW